MKFFLKMQVLFFMAAIKIQIPKKKKIFMNVLK